MHILSAIQPSKTACICILYTNVLSDGVVFQRIKHGIDVRSILFIFIFTVLSLWHIFCGKN